MAYYRLEAKANIVVDASPYGLGAILNQQQSNGEYRPVAYYSKTPADVQRRYSQTGREREFGDILGDKTI